MKKNSRVNEKTLALASSILAKRAKLEADNIKKADQINNKVLKLNSLSRSLYLECGIACFILLFVLFPFFNKKKLILPIDNSVVIEGDAFKEESKR